MASPGSAGGPEPDWSITPLVPPPPGQEVNLANPQSLAPMAIAVSSVVLALMLPSVFLRLYVKTRMLGQVGREDYVAFLGAFLVTVYTVYSIVLFALPGLGPHFWDIPGAVFMDPNFSLRMLFSQILFPPSEYFVKLSILLFYLRVLTGPSSRSKYVIWTGIGIISALYLVLTILSFAFCVPNYSVLEGDCSVKGSDVGEAMAVVGIVTDLFILSIPPFILSRLQMPTRRKVGVAAIFMIGVLATGAAIANLVTRVSLSGAVPDFSWTIMPAAVSTICELNLGVICANLPTLNVLFHSTHKHSTTSSSGSRFGWSLRHLFTRLSTGTSRSTMPTDHKTYGSNQSGQPSSAGHDGTVLMSKEPFDMEMGSYRGYVPKQMR